jgi:Raf kinase inhibitor-like YbhB/YbcL family protein
MRRFVLSIMVAGALPWWASACTPENENTEPDTAEAFWTMELLSDSFEPGDRIPVDFTCDGHDQSPPLRWHQVPDATQSFALICDDPDAPGDTWTHWLIFNLPADARELPTAVQPADTLPNGAKQGMNDFRNPGYGGPCPPPGKPHRYSFRLYALDEMLDLAPGTGKLDLEQAMQGHILAQAELIGTYGR